MSLNVDCCLFLFGKIVFHIQRMHLRNNALGLWGLTKFGSEMQIYISIKLFLQIGNA